jgi:hypothetical protein
MFACACKQDAVKSLLRQLGSPFEEVVLHEGELVSSLERQAYFRDWLSSLTERKLFGLPKG